MIERLTNLDVELVLGAALQVPERVVRVRNVTVVAEENLEFVKRMYSLNTKMIEYALHRFATLQSSANTRAPGCVDAAGEASRNKIG